MDRAGSRGHSPLDRLGEARRPCRAGRGTRGWRLGGPAVAPLILCRTSQMAAPVPSTAAPLSTLPSGRVKASVAQPMIPAAVKERDQWRWLGGSVQAEALAIA